MWREVSRPGSQKYSAQCLRGASVVLYCRGSLRGRARCGAEWPSDYRRSACGCSQDDAMTWLPVLLNNESWELYQHPTEYAPVHAEVRSVHAQLHWRGKCAPCEGFVFRRCFSSWRRQPPSPHLRQWSCPPQYCWEAVSFTALSDMTDTLKPDPFSWMITSLQFMLLLISFITWWSAMLPTKSHMNFRPGDSCARQGVFVWSNVILSHNSELLCRCKGVSSW